MNASMNWSPKDGVPPQLSKKLPIAGTRGKRFTELSDKEVNWLISRVQHWIHNHNYLVPCALERAWADYRKLNA